MTWYIAIVNPSRHRRVEYELANLGYRVFWPKLRRWVSHARTKTAKEFPILGRYMFVEVTDGNFWNVCNVNGVDSLVSDMEGPAPIDPETVWRLRERYMNGEWDFVRRDCKRPIYEERKKDGVLMDVITSWEANDPTPIGARIRVVAGEFEDMLATVTNRKGKRVDFKLKDSTIYGWLNESGVRAA